MKFRVEHSSHYRYSGAVSLGPHVLRLHPRLDGSQHLIQFECDIAPVPSIRCESLDHEGNIVVHAWFEGRTAALDIVTRFELETRRTNPYDYVPQPDFNRLPARYSSAEAAVLARHAESRQSSAAVEELADRLAANAGGNPIEFLRLLNHYLHENIEHEIRLSGGPRAPEMTLHENKGACRDVAVLFMAVCREKGIAARFVSGYQARPAYESERRHLHAWPEVYIPGGGWRGFDPSHGLAVADAHIAVAAAIDPASSAPIEGTFSGEALESELEVELHIETS